MWCLIGSGAVVPDWDLDHYGTVENSSKTGKHSDWCQNWKIAPKNAGEQTPAACDSFKWFQHIKTERRPTSAFVTARPTSRYLTHCMLQWDLSFASIRLCYYVLCVLQFWSVYLCLCRVMGPVVSIELICGAVASRGGATTRAASIRQPKVKIPTWETTMKYRGRSARARGRDAPSHERHAVTKVGEKVCLVVVQSQPVCTNMHLQF